MWWVISRLRSTSDKYIRMFVNHIGDCQRAYRTTEQIFQKNASQFQCWERDSKCTSHLGRIHWRGVRTCTDARKTLNSPCNVPNSKNVFFNWRELSLRYWQITCFSSLNFWKSFFVDWVCTEKKMIHYFPETIIIRNFWRREEICVNWHLTTQFFESFPSSLIEDVEVFLSSERI